MFRDTILRVVGGIALAVIGWHVEETIQGQSPRLDASLLVSLMLSGFLLGLLLTPDLTLRPFLRLKSYVQSLTDEEMLAAVIGLVIALVMSALTAIPLAMLPGNLGRLSPVVFTAMFAYFGVSIGVDRRRRVLDLLVGRTSASANNHMEQSSASANQVVLLDTSVIIDGRIVQISRTGFLPGTLIIPQFVLDELQQLADSSDQRRRTSARHGLDNLRTLKDKSVLPVEVLGFDDEPLGEVDQMLVRVAQRLRCPILTNDFNLSRVAEIKGVPVLNVNVLADSLRPVVSPGDHLRLRMIELGGQPGQARGYLDDGTMVVVENGQMVLGQDTNVIVQRIRQQDTGRIIFATRQPNEPEIAAVH